MDSVPVCLSTLLVGIFADLPLVGFPPIFCCSCFVAMDICWIQYLTSSSKVRLKIKLFEGGYFNIDLTFSSFGTASIITLLRLSFLNTVYIHNFQIPHLWEAHAQDYSYCACFCFNFLLYILADCHILVNIVRLNICWWDVPSLI